MKTSICIIGILAISFTLSACKIGSSSSSSKKPNPIAEAPLDCSALDGLLAGDATVTKSTLVNATEHSIEYCAVSATIPPKLNFEVRLPTVNWNGKLHYSGGGGYNGTISDPNIPALQQGYVNIASDSGHSGNALDASFALNDDYALNLFARLSVPMVTEAAKEIILAAYNEAPSYSYFEGCSNGGREGLMAAIHNPTLFDGIIAGAPARQFVGSLPASQRNIVTLNKPGASFTTGKLELLGDAVLAACDTESADGAVDGIISNIADCNFDLATLRCPGGGDDGDNCLSDAQLALAVSITSPISAAEGALSYPGIGLYGEEASPGQWDTTYLAPYPFNVAGMFYNTGVINLLAKDVNIDPVSYDFEANASTALSMADLIDVTDADLSDFRSAGGKLILWHGSTDALVPVKNTTEYYSGMISEMGRGAVDEFARYYIAPGVHHCAGGSGAPPSDLLSAMNSWVTDSSVPETLTAAKVNFESGDIELSRPLCRHPEYPHYTGSGEINNADSFTCVYPQL